MASGNLRITFPYKEWHFEWQSKYNLREKVFIHYLFYSYVAQKVLCVKSRAPMADVVLNFLSLSLERLASGGHTASASTNLTGFAMAVLSLCRSVNRVHKFAYYTWSGH